MKGGRSGVSQGYRQHLELDRGRPVGVWLPVISRDGWESIRTALSSQLVYAVGEPPAFRELREFQGWTEGC